MQATSCSLRGGGPGEAPVELLQNLIRFDTSNPPGNERACLSYIQGLLDEASFETKMVGRSPDRPNLIARLPGSGQSPPLLLHGHADVVPANPREWRHPPFAGNVVDGYVWGRGALDMKGGIAMMVAALLRAKAENCVPPGDVVLAVVSDEEAGGEFGTKYLVENYPELFEGIRYAVGEFGGFSFPIGKRLFYPVMVAEKRLCVLRATIRGTGGHGSLKSRASATSRLAQFLHRLERRPLPLHLTPVTRQMFRAVSSNLPFPSNLVFRQLLRKTTAGPVLKALGENGLIFGQLLRNSANPTMIRGGEQINVVPTEISLGLDGRLLPGFSPTDLMDEVRRIVGGQVELEVVHYDPGPPESDLGLFDTLADILRQADPQGVPVPMLLPGATDGRFLARLGIQSYGFIPMALPVEFAFSSTVHGANERVPVEALRFGAEALHRLLHRFGEGGPSPLRQSGWRDPKEAVSWGQRQSLVFSTCTSVY